MPKLKFDWPKALGEFLVIVIGVLAALAVDEWRGERDDREIETAYLSRLTVDVERDIQVFTEEAVVLQTKAAFVQDLLDNTIEQQFSDNPRALMEAKVYSSFRGVPGVARSTFDELLSTGRLALIRDVDLRSALSAYYAGYASLNEQVNALSPGDYAELVNGSVPGSIAREWRLSNSISEPREFLKSLQKLRQHPGLLAAANSEITYATALEFYLMRYREQAAELLRHLQQVVDG